MKFIEALNEMIYNKKRVARKCWKGYKGNWLEFDGKSFISGYGEYDMKEVFNINNLLLSDDWEIIEKEKKPSEILLNLKGTERLEKAYSIILDEMYEDIKKLKEK
jgi:hypothetical protein